MFEFKNDWQFVLGDELKKEYFLQLEDFLAGEYEEGTCLPPKDEVFSAFDLTPYEKVKVLILGQDPYHQVGQAHGLCFSVRDGVKIPPSLVNIYKELIGEGILDEMPTSGYLEKWARQGVLMINAVMTVKEGQAGSHGNMGWERFTDRVIEVLNEKSEPVVFILWGNYARSKKKLITDKKHLVIEGVHPSPLSAFRGFFDGRFFGRTNEFLVENGLEPIDFRI